MIPIKNEDTYKKTQSFVKQNYFSELCLKAKKAGFNTRFEVIVAIFSHHNLSFFFYVSIH